MGADEYWSMCLCMIFHNINIQGFWGDAKKVLNKCPNDDLYICEDLANILHDVVEFRCALMHAVWMHYKAFTDGGDACSIFWGWLDACIRTVLKVSEG